MANVKSARGRAYTAQEDLLLCQSWVSITQDPIVGTDQSGAQFWERIYSTFKVLLGYPTDRTATSLISRFQIISKEVALFIGKLSNATSRAGSGTTEADKIREARVQYLASSGKAFKFDECYEILKEQPKFSLRTTQIFDRVPNTQFGEGSESPNSPTINLDSDLPMDTDSPTPLTRPPGRKASKRKGKSVAETSGIKDMAEETVIFTAVYKESQVSRNAIKARECDLRERIEEDRIMAIDLSTLPTSQRYYFMCRQNKIMQKRGYNDG